MKSLTTVVVLLLCALPFPALGAGKTVHVRGYTRKDGTYVAPYMRSSARTTSHGYSTPAYAFVGTPVSPQREVGRLDEHERGPHGGRPTGYRTAYRTTAREAVAVRPPKPKRQYPIRDWHAPDGRVLGHGRMKYRAGDVLRIESEDGNWHDLDVTTLHQDDVKWLESARRDPNSMKTDILPVEADGADDDGN